MGRRWAAFTGLGVVLAIAAFAVASEPASLPPPSGESGDVFGANQGCAEQYTPRSLAKADAAFDGTVTAIEDGAVIFRVHRWYRNGKGDHVFVAMPQPTPKITIGSRMLVSGASTNDGRLFVAWTCGFTRWYNEHDAAVWRRAFGFPFASCATITPCSSDPSAAAG